MERNKTEIFTIGKIKMTGQLELDLGAKVTSLINTKK